MRAKREKGEEHLFDAHKEMVTKKRIKRALETKRKKKKKKKRG